MTTSPRTAILQRGRPGGGVRRPGVGGVGPPCGARPDGPRPAGGGGGGGGKLLMLTCYGGWVLGTLQAPRSTNRHIAPISFGLCQGSVREPVALKPL